MSLTQVINGLLADGAITTAKLADASVGAANIIDANVTAAKLANASVTTAKLANSGYELGPRNRIINGAMNISQRGTTFAAIASTAYSLDRWRIGYTTTAVATVSQQADVPSSNEFQNSLRVTVTTADTSIEASDYFYVQQFVEGYNARDLLGRTFTLSFWVRSSKTGTHCVSFGNAGADQSYIVAYTISAANTWEYKTVTISGGLTTGGTWTWTNGRGLVFQFILACGSAFQATAGAWQTGNFIATANQVNCLDTIGNIFAITGVQLEAGSSATPFEYVDFGTEFAKCQRYFEICGFIATATSPPFTSVRYTVKKRATPNSLTPSVSISPATLNNRLSDNFFSMDGNPASSVALTVSVDAEL